MTPPVLTVEEVGDVAAWFSRTYTGWTWPELRRALDSVLPETIARDALPTLIAGFPDEPRHPAAALRQEWFADPGNWLRTATPRLRHYRVWTREKRDGVRVIEVPKPRLREAQRRRLRLLVSRIPAHPAAAGFIPGSSTSAFAQPHSGSATVLRVDLRHCFASITTPRIAEVFRRAGYPSTIARLLAHLCTTATPADQLTGVPAARAAYLRGRHLSQGAPTSLHLSNLVMRSMDRTLIHAGPA